MDMHQFRLPTITVIIGMARSNTMIGADVLCWADKSREYGETSTTMLVFSTRGDTYDCETLGLEAAAICSSDDLGSCAADWA